MLFFFFMPKEISLTIFISFLTSTTLLAFVAALLHLLFSFQLLCRFSLQKREQKYLGNE